jgi:hypothetical protein
LLSPLGVLTIENMSNHLRSAFVWASDLALASITDVARGIDRVRRTVHMYRAGHRRVTPEAARDLAAYLRERAKAFLAAADELERAARKEEGNE